MRRTLVRAVARLAVLGLVAATPVEAQPKGTIKIATQSPLSGELAALGEGITLGARLALEKLKGPIEKAGFKVELAPFDDQGKPDVGVANAKKIVADTDVLAVIGHLSSSVALPSSEVYKDVSLVVISPADTHPLITDRHLPTVNRVCGRDDVQGVVAAKFATDVLKAKTVYIVHNRSPYGRGIAEVFQDVAKQGGVQVQGFEGTEERADFAAILTAVAAKSPDVLFFGGEYLQAAALFRQAREKGIKAQFLGPDGLDSSELSKLGGDAVVGLHYTTVAGPLTEYPRAGPFADEYRKLFGKAPEPFAAQAYDATAIALKGLEAAIREGKGRPPSREAVARAVRKVRHVGITGPIEFDDKGDPKKARYFVIRVAREWKDNRAVKSMEIEAPAARNP